MIFGNGKYINDGILRKREKKIRKAILKIKELKYMDDIMRKVLLKF